MHETSCQVILGFGSTVISHYTETKNEWIILKGKLMDMVIKFLLSKEVCYHIGKWELSINIM